MVCRCRSRRRNTPWRAGARDREALQRRLGGGRRVCACAKAAMPGSAHRVYPRRLHPFRREREPPQPRGAAKCRRESGPVSARISSEGTLSRNRRGQACARTAAAARQPECRASDMPSPAKGSMNPAASPQHSNPLRMGSEMPRCTGAQVDGREAFLPFARLPPQSRQRGERCSYRGKPWHPPAQKRSTRLRAIGCIPTYPPRKK